MATKLNQPGLVRMEQLRRTPQVVFASRRGSDMRRPQVLEANDQIVGVPHDDHVALGLRAVSSGQPRDQGGRPGRYWQEAVK